MKIMWQFLIFMNRIFLGLPMTIFQAKSKNILNFRKNRIKKRYNG